MINGLIDSARGSKRLRTNNENRQLHQESLSSFRCHGDGASGATTAAAANPLSRGGAQVRALG